MKNIKRITGSKKIVQGVYSKETLENFGLLPLTSGSVSSDVKWKALRVFRAYCVEDEKNCASL